MPFALGQADVQEWTNKSGQTIQAKFVEANAKFVTLFLKGQNYVYRLSDLSEESQALAKKLAQASPSSSDNPSIEKPGGSQLGEAEKGKTKQATTRQKSNSCWMSITACVVKSGCLT